MLVVFETCSLAVKKAKISHEGEAGVCGVENGGAENGGVLNGWRNVVSWLTSTGELGVNPGWHRLGCGRLGAAPTRSDPASATQQQTTELAPLSFHFPIGEMEGLNAMVPGVPHPQLWSPGCAG